MTLNVIVGKTGFNPEMCPMLNHISPCSFEEDDNDIADLISTFGLSPEAGRKQQRSNLGGRMSKKADGNTSDESNAGATLKDKLPKFSNFDPNGGVGNSIPEPRRFRDGSFLSGCCLM